MTRTIDGVKYLMRDTRPRKALMELYRTFCQKFGPMNIHQWLVERGKVYKRVERKSYEP